MVPGSSKRSNKSPDKPRKRHKGDKKGKGHASMRIGGPLPGLPPLAQSSLATLPTGQDDSDVSDLSSWDGIEELNNLLDNKKAVPEREYVDLPPEIEKTLEDARNDIRTHMLSLAKEDQRYVNWDRTLDQMSNISTEFSVAFIRMGVLNKKLMQLQRQHNCNSEILQNIWKHLTNKDGQGSEAAHDESNRELAGESKKEQ